MRDVCIIGGGLVGLSAALTLARQGRSVSLLEARDLSVVEPEAMDARSIALSLSSQRIFEALEIWDDLRPNCAPIRHIHVSSAGHLGATRLHADELGLEAMGQVIEYHLLQQSLLVEAERERSVELLFPARVEALRQQPQGIDIDCLVDDRPHPLQARLLLLADGGQSALGEQLGLRREQQSYRQTAIVANLRVERDGAGWAWERFTADGPMAWLPLSGGRYALVWTLPPDQAAAMLDAPDDAFIDGLHRRFGYRLGRILEVGRRAHFELMLRRTRPLAGPRWALLGNAANALHPVAGQGFNLALRDVAVLHDVLQEQGLEKEIAGLLSDYARRRETDQQRSVDWGSRLVDLFSNDLPLLDHARAAALGLLERCAPLKREVAWQGMGYGAGLSSLMRGLP